MPILSESQVRQAMPLDKPYKLYESGGLYLKVSTSGAKLWRFKYRFGQAERLLALGKYPDVALKDHYPEVSTGPKSTLRSA